MGDFRFSFENTLLRRFLGFGREFIFILLDYAIGLKFIVPLIYSINSRLFSLNSPLLFLISLGLVMVIELNVVVVVEKMILG